MLDFKDDLQIGKTVATSAYSAANWNAGEKCFARIGETTFKLIKVALGLLKRETCVVLVFPSGITAIVVPFLRRHRRRRRWRR